MKFTSSILLLVLPALSIARPSLRVRGDDSDTALLDTMLELKYVGDVDSIPGNSGSIGIASASEGPREYPLLAGPSMNITLIDTGASDPSVTDGDNNGTALTKRQGNLRCVRVCMNGRCHVGNCQLV